VKTDTQTTYYSLIIRLKLDFLSILPHCFQALTSFMKGFQQLDLVQFVLLPMFLFSATLYPITVYPDWVQVIVTALPLWHGVELMRQLSVGYLDLATLGHAAYFVVMSAVGIVVVTLRLRTLFLR